MEHEVYVADFEELRYQDSVQEFYAALLDVMDIDAQVWSVTVRGLTFMVSANILAGFLGMQRPIGAFPTVEMENKPSAKDLCVGSGTRLTDMESKMAGLQSFLTRTLGTLRVMSRRLGAIEDQMGKMRENSRDRSTELGSEHDPLL
ncbi:hypothetical protein CJ030_MR7G027511 [Morella rubra]|uniref:Uncharacterized protein n=1 Tax=Morella rubra TaxID=262757 RepID=A0A6A1UYY8_9ROSI|nr:hypothetical protein CJ030_MR7G027505 [Morella rubra]KAB1205573.1 hypothetical protein CJ030_MR7G027511 [Morella rubra]